MAYQPSLNDIPMTSQNVGYKPTLLDIPATQPSIAMQYVKQAQAPDLERQLPSHVMQTQEEYSNPTAMPGFNQLSKQEQLERIKFSQFDPANQTSLGGYVPGGAYESAPARMAATILPSLALPELGVGEGLLSRYILDPILNSAARIGTGTASNVAYQAPNIKNIQDLKNVTKSNLGLNSLLEAGGALGRLPGYAAEMFNPINYAAQKADTIKNEFQAAQQLQKEAYAPVTAKYGDQNVTYSPEKYLGFDKGDIKYFTPDIKKSYSDFLDEPTFQNLHDLQSQMGKDWVRMASNPNKINTAQTLSAARDSIKDKIQGFLSQDQNALNQYNLGSDITKNQVMPYLSNPTLRKISYGKINSIDPSKLSGAIEKGTQKEVGSIPASHPLINHMNDLNNIINFGKGAQFVVPAAIGAAAGELVHPGLGSALAGLSSGLGTSQLASMAAKFGAPSMSGFVQNPLTRNVASKINPLYYGLGRSIIGNTSQNK